MRIPTLAALSSITACALAITAHAETAVYKCAKPDGIVVFTPTPCGANAKTVVAPRQPGTAVIAAPKPAAPNAAIQAIHDGVEDAHCRDEAHALYREPDRSALTRAQDEINTLEKRTWTGRNAAAIQILVEQDRTRIASLRGIVATEQMRIDTARTEAQHRVDDAIAKCDEIKAKRTAAGP